MKDLHCPHCGFTLALRRMESVLHFERGVKTEAVCYSCGKCYGLENQDVPAAQLDRMELPWRVDSQPQPT